MRDQDATAASGRGHTPLGPYATGCRIHKPEYDRARDAAEAWTGRQDGLDHWALLDLLEAEGVPERFGLKARHINYLRLAFKKLSREDFEPGHWPPVVWINKQKLARNLRTSSRAVSNIEKDLAAAGFIYWTDTASLRREGERSKHDGRIRYAYGVDFSPFDAMAHEIEDTARQVEEEEIERRGLIHEIATIRCHMRILLQASLRLEPASDQAIHPLLGEVLALPASRGLQCAGIDVLRSLADEARRIQDRALMLTQCARAAPGIPPAGNPHAPNSTSSEDQNGAKNCTPGYHSDPRSNSITHQFQEITLGAAGPPAKPSPEPTTQPAARPSPERGVGSPAGPAVPPIAGGPPTWLILESLSPRLSRYLPSDRHPTAEEFLQASGRSRSELGISPEAWRDACTALSPAWASLAVVIVASRDDAGEIHTSAGGYFRKLTEKARDGTLNLAGSLWGVIDRSEKLHIARITGPTDGEHSVPGPDSHPQIASSRPDRQRADQPTMTAILRTTRDPKGLALAWRDLVARYRCWPYVDEVQAHYASLQSPSKSAE